MIVYCTVLCLSDCCDLGKRMPVLVLPNRGPGQSDTSRDFDSFSNTDNCFDTLFDTF